MKPYRPGHTARDIEREVPGFTCPSIDKAIGHLEELRITNAHMRGLLDHAVTEISAAHDHIDELESDITSKEARIDELEAELASCKHELERLEHLV